MTQQFATADPRHHTEILMRMLTDTLNHARDDVGTVTDPKARAPFETTAEVLGGLLTAYNHDDSKEPAWR